MSGWIKLHRKMLEWEWYSCPNTKAVFLHFLIAANWKEKSWCGIRIPRGSLFTSDENLSAKLGLSRQQIRTAITRLKSTNEITIESTNRGKLVTVCNFDAYNIEDGEFNQGDNQGDNQRATNEQPTSNQRATTTKEGKKDKKERTEDEDGAPRPSSASPDFDPITTSDLLTSRGEYLEALSRRIALPAGNIREIVGKFPPGCFETYLRNRAAEGWRTRGNKPIGMANWFADFERFAAAWSKNEPESKVRDNPRRIPEPEGWQAVYASIDPDPLIVDGEYAAPEWERLTPSEQSEVVGRMAANPTGLPQNRVSTPKQGKDSGRNANPPLNRNQSKIA